MKQLQGASNYRRWRIDAQFACTITSCWSAITKPMPLEENYAGLADSEKYLTDLREWQLKDDTACGNLVRMVSPSIIDEILDCKTSAQIWNHLKAKYERKLDPYNTWVAFMEFRIRSTNLSGACQAYRRVLADVRETGHEINEKTAVNHL